MEWNFQYRVNEVKPEIHLRMLMNKKCISIPFVDIIASLVYHKVIGENNNIMLFWPMNMITNMPEISIGNLGL